MKACITGSSGFIGYHLTKYLKSLGYWVKGIDIKFPEFGKFCGDEFLLKDLRYIGYSADSFYNNAKDFEGIEEVYHLAADMGGIGYIETHKSDIVFNNSLINLLTLQACCYRKVKKFLFTSSACVYPSYLQNELEGKPLKESDAYPAQAEDGYGWEKLMMERTCQHFAQDYKLKVYIARLHNIYGPLGAYKGGREKSPAALCRKIALARSKEWIDIWGDGKQVRSYCYIDDCVVALHKLMESNYHEPINIGTSEAISIDALADLIANIAGKTIYKSYVITAPQGVRYRNADITKAQTMLDWSPKVSLQDGLTKTYKWIDTQISV